MQMNTNYVQWQTQFPMYSISIPSRVHLPGLAGFWYLCISVCLHIIRASFRFLPEKKRLSLSQEVDEINGICVMASFRVRR